MLKKENIIGIVYYILLIILHIFLLFYVLNGGAILSLNLPIMIILIIVIPIVLLIIPLFINLKFSNYYKTFKISTIIALLYIITMFITHFSVIEYSKTFTVEKWESMRFLRYIMVDDLEEKYELDKMDKEEVIKLLGNPDIEKDTSICYFIKDDTNDHYFCLNLENNKVISTYKNNGYELIYEDAINCYKLVYEFKNGAKVYSSFAKITYKTNDMEITIKEAIDKKLITLSDLENNDAFKITNKNPNFPACSNR